MHRPSPRRLIALAVGTGGYLVLAVLLRGGPAAFLAHPPLIGLAVALVAMGVASAFAGGSLSPGIREDRANRWVLPVFAVLGVLTALVPPWTDRRDLWSLDGETIRWVGVALFAAGGALRLWPVFVLGDRFSGLVAIQPGHRLLTTGIYATIRHPSYLGLLIGSLGWSLAFRSVAGVVLTALLIPPLLGRIGAEERLLAETFGAEYAAYRARTARMIPGLY